MTTQSSQAKLQIGFVPLFLISEVLHF